MKNIEIEQNKNLVNEYFKSTSCAADLKEFHDNNAMGMLAEAIMYQCENNVSFYFFRILSWNCDWNKNGITNDKMKLIKMFSPEIIVLQECTYKDCIKFKNEYKNIVWYGDGKDSMLGIGLFSNTFQFELLPSYSYDVPFRYVIPYSVKKDDLQFTLLAVWTKEHIKINSDDGNERLDPFHCLDYLDNLIKAIDYYEDLFKDTVLIIGDFNSADLQEKRRPAHLKVIEKLAEHSVYNCTKFPNFDYDDDLEFSPTFYQNYQKDKAYTNDYCFMSHNLNNTVLKHFYAGIPEKWLNYSDHFPIMLDIGTGK